MSARPLRNSKNCVACTMAGPRLCGIDRQSSRSAIEASTVQHEARVDVAIEVIFGNLPLFAAAGRQETLLPAPRV